MHSETPATPGKGGVAFPRDDEQRRHAEKEAVSNPSSWMARVHYILANEIALLGVSAIYKYGFVAVPT